MRYLKFCATAVFLALSACTELPVSGPDHRDIVNRAAEVVVTPPDEGFADYVVMDMNARVVAHAVDIDPGSFFRSFGNGKGANPEILVGVGDVLQLTVFESKSGGLFIPADSGTRPGNYVTLPPQAVDYDGYISVPYAGNILAAGKSLTAIQKEIEQKLSNRAIEPKVIATIFEQNATAVSVVGEVNTPKKVRLTQGGERVLDMIAGAGGIRYPGYEIFVTLQRGRRKATVYFNSLITHPEENIFVRPGDTVYVYREPRRFIAFGAVASGNTAAAGAVSQQINFDQERVSLAEGVAKAGGLLDDRANPGMTFLYRLEKRDILLAMGADLGRFPPEQKAVPTVYRANFRDPAAYFAAQQFPLRHRDIIYVSNADAVEVTKFLAFTRSITSTVAGVTDDAAVTRNAATYVGSGKVNGY